MSVSRNRLWPKTCSVRTSWPIIAIPHVLLSVFLPCRIIWHTVQLSCFPLTHCSMLTKRRLPALKQQSFFSGSCRERTAQRRATTGLQQPTQWHRSALLSRQNGGFGRCEWGNKIGRVQAPWASHVSCMTAFHHRGQLKREAGSCLCEVPTDKYWRNATEYFLIWLWHHDTKHGSGSANLYYVKPFGALWGLLTEARRWSGQLLLWFTLHLQTTRLRNTCGKAVFFLSSIKACMVAAAAWHQRWRRHADIIRATLQPVFSTLL